MCRRMFGVMQSMAFGSKGTLRMPLLGVLNPRTKASLLEFRGLMCDMSLRRPFNDLTYLKCCRVGVGASSAKRRP